MLLLHAGTVKPKTQQKLHQIDQHLSKTGATHLHRFVHEPCKVIGHPFVQNGLLHGSKDQVRSLGPTDVPEHHLGGQNGGPRVDVVFARIFGCRAVRGLKASNRV